MIAVTNAIRVKKGTGSELEVRFAKPKHVHQSPGFIGLELLKNSKSEEYDEYQVRTLWEDEESFTNWTKSSEFQRAHARREEGKGKPESESNVISVKLTVAELISSYGAAEAVEAVAASTAAVVEGTPADEAPTEETIAEASADAANPAAQEV